MRLAIFLAVLGTSLCWAADAKDEAVKKEMEKLQGTWKVVKAIKRGDARSDDDLKKIQVVIAGDKLTVTVDGKSMSRTFTIDPQKKPATIDLITRGEPTIQGIYELDKDSLKICADPSGNKRPTKFEAGENSSSSMMVLERDKK